MLKQLSVVLVLMVVSLSARVEPYLKKVGPKPAHHNMEQIDFIYMLNLDQRPEKFARSKEALAQYGISPYRFSAVNGWELPLAVVNDVGVRFHPSMKRNIKATTYLPENHGEPSHEMSLGVPGRTYFCHCMSRGAVAIVLSHLSILQDAYDSRYKTIWVMEDDIEIIKNPNELSRLIAALDGLVGADNWDILFTDRDTKNQRGEYVPCHGFAERPNFTPSHPARFSKRRDVGKYFTQVGARYGAYSMIVRRSGMKKILDHIKKHQIFLPYDMDFYLMDDIRMFAVKDDVVSTLHKAESDNGAPNYLKNQ